MTEVPAEVRPANRAGPASLATAPLLRVAMYRVNLLLLVLLAVLLMVWFNLHVQPYVTQSLLIGGTLTLWGIWRVALSWLKWGAKSETDKLARSMLASSDSREYLIFALVVVGLLFATTSSVYIVHDGGAGEYTVELRRDGQLWLDPINVASTHRIAGRPFFLQLTKRTIGTTIAAPGGFADTSRTLWPWTPLRLRVPSDFRRKTLHLLRVIPTGAMYVALPAPGANAVRPVRLAVIVQGRRYQIESLHHGAVYVGAAERDIRWRLAREDERVRRTVFFNHLTAAGATAAERDEVTRNWLNNVTVLPTRDFGPGTVVHVVIDRTDAAVLLDTVVTMPDGDTIATVFVGGQP